MISYNLVLTKRFCTLKWRHMSPWRPKPPIIDWFLFKSIFQLRWNKIKQHITILTLFEGWIPLKIRQAFPYHDVIILRLIWTPWLWHRRCKNLSIFFTWGSPIIMTTDVANWMREIIIYHIVFIKPLIQSEIIFLEQYNDLNNKS